MTTSDSPHGAITVGCAELPPGMNRAAYFRALPLLEMRLPGDRIPPARVADRWASEAGRAGRIALVAPRSMMRFHQADADARAAIEETAVRLAETAVHTGAAALVFCTPPDLSPSSAHRDALRRFFGDTASPERFAALRVWQPDGLWRPPSAAAFAAELGVIAAVDPLAPDPLEEGVPEAAADAAYARVTGLGRAGRPLGTDDLDRLVEWAASSQRAAIVFATPTRFRDAVALARSLSDGDEP
jgi:uncharacterized protein YecE (DUF72 family)